MTALFHLLARYVVNTDPTSIVEELLPVAAPMYGRPTSSVKPQQIAHLVDARPSSQTRTEAKVQETLADAPGIEGLDTFMDIEHLIFRVHAIQRMFERAVSKEDVRQVLATGKIIETYPYDKPYPSCLVLGWSGTRPIHVVVADNLDQRETIVITVYEPDLDRWEPGFEKRRQ